MKKFLLSFVAMTAMALTGQAYTVSPEANTVLPKAYSNYVSMSFTFNFDQAVTVGDLGGVKLMKDDPATGTEVAPDDDWRANTSNGGKTVTLWGADYDGFTCAFACEDADYYLVVPAGVLGDEAITVKYYGMNAPQLDPLTMVSADPEPETVLPKLYGNYVSWTFTLTFNRPITVNSLDGVKLMEGDAVSGTQLDPMDEWRSNLSASNATSVTLWGADYDGFTDYFLAQDMPYYLVIPAGAFQAGDATNEEIVIEYYGQNMPTVGISDINTGSATEVARYNIAGQRVDANHGGVVIVKMSDGSTMKMVVR